MRIKLRTAGLDDLTSIYGIRRDSILGVQSEASLSDSPGEQLSRHKRRLKDERNCSGTLASDYARGVF